MNNNSTEILIKGMTCSNCALGLEKNLRKHGFSDAVVSFANSAAQLFIRSDEDLQKAKQVIVNCGFKIQGDLDKSWYNINVGIQHKLLFSSIFTIPLLLPMFVKISWLMNPYIQLTLAIPVICLAIFHFGVSAFRSLKANMPNMDVLIFIGVFSAFIYSVIGLLLNLGQDYLFFETAATITTLVLLGNFLEHQATTKTASAIQELSKIQVKEAQVIQQINGVEVVSRVSVDTLQIGDLVLINTGDQIPVDGHVVWGSGSVDESMITGESFPVEKTVKSPVVATTTLQTGSLKVKTSALGSDTIFSKIINLMRQAQLNKPDIQRLGDRVSAFFVPAVVIIALLTLLISLLLLNVSFQDSLLRSIAVLVISCPCAMGLATPTAVMVGIGLAAKNGILFKGGDIIEQLAKTKQVVFDKTGTITTGKFVLSEMRCFQESEALVKQALLGLEIHSSHPIAKSLVDYLKDSSALRFEQIEEFKGIGMQGTTKDGDIYIVGSRSILEPDLHKQHFDIYLTKNGELIAGILLGDELKPDAKKTITTLKESSITPFLLSGDTKTKCQEVALITGIDDYYYQKTPEEKLAILKQLSAIDSTTFIGDGINDAPALMQAEIGISLGDSSQIAIQSADIILLNSRLESIIKALKISKDTLTTIKQNLFWAFAYNIIAIPLASAGYLNPMIAALAMAFSDVFVVGNSLRLKYRL